MITLSHNKQAVKIQVPLSASKSESNRALIIQALSKENCTLENLSSARDTQTMIRLLKSGAPVLDVKDAGTTMRFLTAYLCAASEERVLTGTQRMKERPVGILVDALRELGAKIRYLENDGYPPIEIQCKNITLSGSKLRIRGDVSSQYISALLMIAPTLSDGLQMELTAKTGSKPYIRMTLGLMSHFGVEANWNHPFIEIPHAAYRANTYRIESDWSAASYWYSIAALSKDPDITLIGLRQNSWQGDAHIAEIMTAFGIHTDYTENGIRLRRMPVPQSASPLTIDFSDTPDLAQTIAVVAAASNVPIRMTGLESLRIKETDRILALQTELAKFGIEMVEDRDAFIIRGDFWPSRESIETYEDHRMAMAFAPLALCQEKLQICNPKVVAKSYPEFWDHLEIAGFRPKAT